MLRGIVREIEVVGQYRDNPFAYDIHIETPNHLFLTLDDHWDHLGEILIKDNYYRFWVECILVRDLTVIPTDDSTYVGTVIGLDKKFGEDGYPKLTHYYSNNDRWCLVKNQYGNMLIERDYFIKNGLENISLGEVVYWNCSRLDAVGYLEIKEEDFFAED